ncbi:anoctamin-7-like isoform X2 [Stegostoma tigrinum]|uniref:anoctamin-7-like isoform X2 n=1 Tax=Stegostoma tigrinum TaxID=3053191 RepID=UPI00202B500C|nr:anoctamin-7-like isoform X2 [Stegostoma tigrinum]
MEGAEERPDYVLVYEKEEDGNGQLHAEQRLDFLREVKKTGLLLDPDVTDAAGTEGRGSTEMGDQQQRQEDKTQIIKIYAPFEVLSHAAEKMRLKLPLAKLRRLRGQNLDRGLIRKIKVLRTIDDFRRKCVSNVQNYFETDKEEDYYSAPYRHDKQDLFKGIDQKATFFRPAVRSLIVHHILNHIQTLTDEQDEKGEPNQGTEMHLLLQSSKEKDYEKEGGEEEDGAKESVPTLPILLVKKVFTSAYTLHEGPKSIREEKTLRNCNLHNSWNDLLNLWARTYRLQPLWKIRNYFGEKVAFYFAVMELLLLQLILPASIGLVVFMFGLYRSVLCYNAHKDMNSFLFGYNCSIICSTPNIASEVADKALDPIRGICDNVAQRRRNIEHILNKTCTTEAHNDCVFQVPSDDTVEFLKSSFDNAATPIFGFFICIWGTIFLEKWKTKNAELIYEWDIENYENDELVRPQFYRTKRDRIDAFFPDYRRRLKFALSLSVGIVMVGCVFISVLAVVIYKTWVRFRVTTSDSLENFFLTTVISSLFNAISIIALGKGYQKLAVIMTNWENHRTQTAYNDALIIKLFAFEFANNYSPLFYIAFLRTNNEQFFTQIGLPGLEDNCGELNNCMTELCFQVLILMITHPLPKFLKDVIVPWGSHLLSRFCGNANKGSHQKEYSTVDDYILRDYNKPDLGDFTLEEYTEKVIQYGLQMLFAVSFPLGPFIFFLTILFDIRLDAKRLLLMYKRPIADMAQDIGHWYTILDLINNVAVVTNGCIIAFTSECGREKLLYEKLIILILFEHLVFVFKFLLSTWMPDVPPHIRQAIKEEKYIAQKEMENDEKARQCTQEKTDLNVNITEEISDLH